ncbi:MAG: hypothetical protein QOJ16_147 [Acidobacteriota bacterium]|jgi:hypothetical protein|nr:hypothetical protein [Acidobacteriota bacterium]
MERAALALLIVASAVACSSGKPPMSSAQPAQPAAPAETATSAATAKAEDTAAPKAPAAPAACDHKIVAMSDPAQKQIQCANGESFVIRQGKDGKWYPEMRVRAGIVPGYATPDEAAQARCCPPASP